MDPKLTPYEVHEWIAARVAKYNRLPHPPVEIELGADAEGIPPGVYRRNDDGVWVRVGKRRTPPQQAS